MSVAGLSIDADLLSRLRCPVSQARLLQVGDWLYTIDPASRRKYPIRDGIPILLVHEGLEVDGTEYGRVMQTADAARNGES